MSQSNFKQKEISQILLKPNFKAFWQSEEGFQRWGFLYRSPGFYTPQKYGSNRVKLFFYALFKKIVVAEFLLSYWGNHSLIFGLNNLSKFLRILRNNLVLLKVCLENQVSCTSLITLKYLKNTQGDIDLLILCMDMKT